MSCGGFGGRLWCYPSLTLFIGRLGCRPSVVYYRQNLFRFPKVKWGLQRTTLVMRAAGCLSPAPLTHDQRRARACGVGGLLLCPGRPDRRGLPRGAWIGLHDNHHLELRRLPEHGAGRGFVDCRFGLRPHCVCSVSCWGGRDLPLSASPRGLCHLGLGRCSRHRCRSGCRCSPIGWQGPIGRRGGSCDQAV